MQAPAAEAEAQLQADTEAAVCAATGRDQLLAAFDRYFQRLLAQHVLAGGERGFRDRQVRIRRV